MSTPDGDATQADVPYIPPPHQVQEPAADPSYRLPDWWKDAVTNDDLMLVWLLTLEGFETRNISHRLKTTITTGLNEYLGDNKIIYQMQDNLRSLFVDRHMSRALMWTMADGFIQAFVKWCKDDTSHLFEIARAKEFEEAGGDKHRLQLLARARTARHSDIRDDYGCTTKWVDERVKDSFWKSRLLEWWDRGTVNGKIIPEMRP